MNIYEKILNIMKEVTYLSKDDKVSFGNTRYMAISEEKVTTLMHNKLVENGLVIYPVDQTWERRDNITHVDVTYRIVNAEDPKEFIQVVSCGDGADTQDKGSGKAMTYAYKYMWLRTFAIPTGEDPDKVSSEELDAQKIGTLKAKALATRCQTLGVNVDKLLEKYGVEKMADLTEPQHLDITKKLNKAEEAKHE